MHPEPVRDLGGGIYQLPTDYPHVCNAPLWSYLVADGDRFAVIDPGVRSTLDSELARAVAGLGLSLEQADLVVATHGHPDHSGGQSSWQERIPGIRVAAPLADTPWIESFDRQWEQCWDDYPGVLDLGGERAAMAALCVPEPEVSLLLRPGDSFEVGSRRFEVIDTGGHTRGHCAYLERDSGALFTGDSVQGRGVVSSDGVSVFSPMYVDVEGSRASLRRLLDVPFTTLCPAHFGPMDRDAGVAFLHDSLAAIDDLDAIARQLVDESGGRPVRTAELAMRIGEHIGTRPPLSPQSVATARAHLYALAREGLLDAAWLPRTS